MPISALPQSTVRLLGSSVTITNPCDLVKELVDNAIDARATSIEVTISPNSIDKITVRDDGHGIEVEDFDSLGRRTYTSKIKTFDELIARAGETLGFRGEALASANSVATVIVTTRTTRDPVASRLQLKFGVGGVMGKQPVSAPVGTMVQATRLFENLPARKQYTVKNSHRSISAIKELLKTYALARPYLRLSFKIPGDSSHSWSYAPNNSPTVHEAVLQIFGKNLAMNCIQISHATESGRHISPQNDGTLHAAVTLDAFIPRPGFDVQAVKGKGTFISVDFRPVSSTRGISKKIAAIFKSHVSRALSAQGSAISLTSPFMQLNIRCPQHAYDPNVSPLKDEVLFADEKQILDSFEALCQKIYWQTNVAPGGHEMLNSQARTSTTGVMELGNDTRDLSFATNPLGSGENDEFFGSFLLDDPEVLGLLDLLDEEPQPDSLADPGEPTLCQPQEPFQGPQMVSATMRVAKTVNMSRTESGTTENSTVDGIVVQIPLSPEATSPQPRPKIRPKENIERYFHPESQDFHISVDETATSGKQSSTLYTGPHDQPGRFPLQPLSDSALNEINGQVESGSEASSVETGVSQPHNASGGEVDVVFPSHPRMLDSQEPEGMMWFQGTPPDSSPPSRAIRQTDFRSPRALVDVLGLQTPPSTDPSRRERRPNLPFRPPRRINIPTGGAGPTRQGGNGVQTGILRQTRVSLRSIANESTARQAEAGPSVDYGSATGEGLFHDVSPSRQERRIHRRNDISSNDPSDIFRFTSQDQALSNDFTQNILPQQSGQHSHLRQTLLTGSPAPIVLSPESTKVLLSSNEDAQSDH